MPTCVALHLGSTTSLPLTLNTLTSALIKENSPLVATQQSEEMPRHAEPEEPRIFGITEDVLVIPYPSHYDLQWQVPLDNGKEIDHFQIVYYQVRH